ncbi:imidazole glycerol phosphate synthase subunit HisH [Alphaproteobacteria bacterium]|nr:imidazole glycerol phosphate synthase subunit HisH [Alphaproteobacteria bacterium]
MKVGILNFGSGNFFKLQNLFCRLGHDVSVFDKGSVKSCDVLVLPGVGNYNFAIQNLQDKNFVNAIRSHISSNLPTIGICLGMHLMFDASEEHDQLLGKKTIDISPFKVFEGMVENLKKTQNASILPNICWSRVQFTDGGAFSEFDNQEFYFAHSYACVDFVRQKDDGVSYFKNTPFLSMRFQNNLLTTQFHPELSGQNGLSFVEHYLGIL